MAIRFYLQAERNFDGTVRVLECYEYKDPRKVLRGDQEMIELVTRGRVDESIKKEHFKEYSEFESYVQANDKELYAEARAAFEA